MQAVAMQLALHRLVLFVAAHLGVERNWQALAGNHIETLDGGSPVIGL